MQKVQVTSKLPAGDPAEEAEQPVMGPGDLVSAWYEIKAQIDKVVEQVSSMLGYAENVRETLLREFDITVPKLAIMQDAEPNVDAQGPQAPPSPPSAEELKATNPEVAAKVAAGLPEQRPIEMHAQPTTTLDVAQIQADARAEGEDPRQFRKSINQMLGTAMRTIEQ